MSTFIASELPGDPVENRKTYPRWLVPGITLLANLENKLNE